MSLGPLMIDLAGTELTAEERELLRHPLVGGVILFTRNYTDPAQLSALVGAIHAERSPPLIVGVDQEGGRVQRFRAGFSLLPPPRRIGHEFDLEPRAGLALARSMGWLMAGELRAHGVDILDGVYNDFSNEEELREECAQGRDFGMDGKTLIHPNQIGPCNEIFAPTADEIVWAKRIIAVFDEPANASKGVVQIEGRMVERLHAEMARRTVTIADAIATLS